MTAPDHSRKRQIPLASRAPVATAAVCDDGMATFGVLAACGIAAKRSRAAGLDRTHHLQLCVAYVAAVGVAPSRAEVAEDVRDFQSGPLHESAGYFVGSLSGASGVKRSSGLVTLRSTLVATLV